MDTLISVILPVSLAIIMFALGIGLTVSDFTRIVKAPKAFAVGAVSQILLLPMITLMIVLAFDLRAEIAVGFMLLSFCPGGVTSNILARLAGGDVALSVSLTAVVSLLSIATVPGLTAWAIVYFMQDTAPDVSVAGLSVAMFLITTLPVLVGVAIRRGAPDLATRIEPVLTQLSAVLFTLIVLAVLIGNWSLFVENMGSLGPALIMLNIALFAVGFWLARASGLDFRQAKTVSIDTGIQNGTLGITLAALIMPQAEGFSAMVLPSAVYGITMYLVAAPIIIGFRRL